MTANLDHRKICNKINSLNNLFFQIFLLNNNNSRVKNKYR